MLSSKLVFANPYKVIALLMNKLRAEFPVFVPIASSLVIILSTNVISESSLSMTRTKDSQLIDVDLFDNLLLVDRIEAEILLKSFSKSSRSSNLSASVSAVLKISSNDSLNIVVCSLRFFTDVSARRIADVI